MSSLRIETPKNYESGFSGPVIPDKYRADFISFEAYKVKSGDSLVTLAKEATARTGSPWSWKDVAMYNWGTATPKEINWWLWKAVGCQKLDRHGANLLFSDNDDPGIMYLPTNNQPIRKQANSKKRSRGRVATHTKGKDEKQTQRLVVLSKDTLLYDTNSGMVYKVSPEMLEEMRTCNAQLSKIRDDIKKANARPKGQKENDILMGIEALEEYCEVEVKKQEPPSFSGSVPKPEVIIKEFVDLKSQSFIYVPSKKLKRLEAEHKHDKKALNEVIKVTKSDNYEKFVPDKTKNSKEIRKEEIKAAKEEKGPFQITFTSEWKAEGEGSLLNIIRSADARLMSVLLSNSVTAPDHLGEWADNKYPGLFSEIYKKTFGETSKFFEGSAEASFLRYSYGAQALEATFDVSNKNFKVKSNIAGTLDLAKGKCNGKWVIPDIKGLLLKDHIPFEQGYQHKEQLAIRFEIGGEVGGFVGAIGELGVSAVAQIECAKEYEGSNGSKKTPINVVLGGGLDAFAGTHVTGKVTFGIAWFNVVHQKWISMGTIQGSVTASAGAGITYIFELEFDGKVFTFTIKAGVTLKLGGKLGAKGELVAMEALYFISEFARAVDYKVMKDIGQKAFKAHWKIMIALAINPPLTLTTIAVKEVLDHFQDLYTGEEKIKNMAKDILANKDRYSLILTIGVPEAKAALISRLCSESRSFFHGEYQEDAVLKIIESCQTQRELENVLQRVITEKNREDKEVYLDDKNTERVYLDVGADNIHTLLDRGQQSKMDSILRKFHLGHLGSRF